MATIKYDLTDVEAGGGGEQPKPGIYPVKIVEINDRRDQDGKNDLEVVVEFYKHPDLARVWSYLNFGDASRWKFREFTDALGLKPKGSLNPEKLIGKKCRVKISADSYNDEYKGRVNTWLKEKPDADEEEDDDTTEADDSGGDDGDDSDDAAATADDGEDYTEWTVEDLQQEIEERDLEMPKGRKTVDKLADVLLEDDASKEDGGDEGDEAEAAAPEDDYDEWPANELQDEIKQRGLDMPAKPKGRNAAGKHKELLIAALRADDGDDDPFNEADDS